MRPIGVGWTPLWSTRHGTSTQHSSGRLSIRPSFVTLPYTTRGWPVSIQWMMAEPYSTLGATSTVESGSSIRARRSSQPAIWLSQRLGYSSSGTLKRSIRSGRSRLMNHGTYSAKCSLDSVTK